MTPDARKAAVVQEVVSHETGIPLERINSDDRKADAVDARFLSVYLTRKYTGMRLVDIAALHRKASHVPIINALKMVNGRLDVDKLYKDRMAGFEKKVTDALSSKGRTDAESEQVVEEEAE